MTTPPTPPTPAREELIDDLKFVSCKLLDLDLIEWKTVDQAIAELARLQARVVELENRTRPRAIAIFNAMADPESIVIHLFEHYEDAVQFGISEGADYWAYDDRPEWHPATNDD